MAQITGAPAKGPDLPHPRWIFKTAGRMGPAWDWDAGPPHVRELEPVRVLRARALSKHLPSMPYCTTTACLLPVESGLEADLVRELDREPDVVWLASQPVMLVWPDEPKRPHTVDLLSAHRDGRVVLWDARPPHRQDERFWAVAARTQAACTAAGWGYEVFSGSSDVRRLNLMWLANFRSMPAWGTAMTEPLLAAVEAGTIRRLGDVHALDDGYGQTVRAMWHFLWSGDLECDLDAPLSSAVLLSLGARRVITR